MQKVALNIKDELFNKIFNWSPDALWERKYRIVWCHKYRSWF